MRQQILALTIGQHTYTNPKHIRFIQDMNCECVPWRHVEGVGPVAFPDLLSEAVIREASSQPLELDARGFLRVM